MHTPNQSFYSKLILFSSPAILLESQSSSISVDTPPNSHVVLVNSRVPDTKSHSKTRRDKYAILTTITTPLNRLAFEMLHRFPPKSTLQGLPSPHARRIYLRWRSEFKWTKLRSRNRRQRCVPSHTTSDNFHPRILSIWRHASHISGLCARFMRIMKGRNFPNTHRWRVVTESTSCMREIIKVGHGCTNCWWKRGTCGPLSTAIQVVYYNPSLRVERMAQLPHPMLPYSSSGTPRIMRRSELSALPWVKSCKVRSGW